jgi:hypothetical protein
MNRVRGLLLACAALVPSVASAAEMTRIASSFEGEDPFGMFLEAGFERTQQRSVLTRERHAGGEVQDFRELRYLMVDARLNVDLRIGIWKDLEFRYRLPVVLLQNRFYELSGLSDAQDSTVLNNCLNPNGSLRDPSCATTGQGETPLFPVPSSSFRGAIGNMMFGMAYAPFNEKRDATKPTWIVGLDYEAPTAPLMDPSAPATDVERGGIGDRVHKYKLYTSFSKKVGFADPYFHASYMIPQRGPGWYSNCDTRDPAGTLGTPQNCGNGLWNRRAVGMRPPHVLSMAFGSEFGSYEDATQKVARASLDVRGLANWVSSGRYQNELTDVTRKLMATQDYLQIGGQLGVYAVAAEKLGIRVTTAVLYNTPHLLSDELIGKDDPNEADPTGTPSVDVTTTPSEINPTFDFRTDMVSRRFRAIDNFTFRLDLSAVLNF